MTVSTAPTPLSYAGNGSTTAFPIVWKYNAKSHVVATLRSSAGAETVWALTTNYTLTDPGDSGTLTAVVAPATGETLVITLEPPNTQSSDLPLGGDFPSTTVENELDLAAQRDAKIEALFLRAIRVPKTDTRTGSNLELPIDTDRASKFLAFDASGDPIAAAGTSADLGPVTPFIDTLLDDTTAAVARTTLGAVGLTGNETVAGIKAFTGANTHAGDETHSGAESFSGIVTMSGKSLWMSEGAAVASATDCNIWAAGDGNTIHITGANEIQDWGTAPQAGAWMWAIFDSTPQLTYNATTNKLNTNGANYTTVAGDRAFIYADSVSSYVVTIFPLSGSAVVTSNIDRQLFDASGTWTKPSGFASTSIAVIEAWGGGGGGGRGDGGTADPGGGGGGGYAVRTLLLSALGATETVTIGAGGAGRTVSVGNGAGGGNTTLGSLITAYGAGGGGGVAGSDSDGGGGAGDWGGGVDASGVTAGTGGAGLGGVSGGAGGEAGAAGNSAISPYGGGGGGGSGAAGGKAYFGGGGGAGDGGGAKAGGVSINGGNGGANTSAGVAPGGGGGGATNTDGAAGAAGRVVVTVYRN